MTFIDTHVHLMMPEYNGILDAVIARAKAVGVNQFVVPGIDFKTSELALTLSEKYPEIIPAIGLHPMGPDDPLEQFQSLAEDPRVTAIGEIGMDRRAGPVADQEKRFRFFLELAVRNNKPALVHIIGEGAPVLAIMRDYPGLRQKAVWHCFTADRAAADELIDLGMLISCTAILARNKMEVAHDVLRTWPLEQTMLETDGPWLSWPKVGERPNEPTTIVKIAQLIADLKQVSVEEVAQKTTNTARSFFSLD